jgi:hypothetical protein
MAAVTSTRYPNELLASMLATRPTAARTPNPVDRTSVGKSSVLMGRGPRE